MHILPANQLQSFNPNKFMLITPAAAIITFVLFVGMQKLIENDQIVRAEPVAYEPIILIQNIEEKPPIEKEKIKPLPAPMPKPKLVAKITDTDPDIGLDTSLLASTFTAPVIKNSINPNFSSAGGDARPIVRVEPKYPTLAARDGIEGWVKLSFSITPTGTVDNISVIDAQPKRTFNQAARRALAKWKYKPNIQAGKAQAQDGMMVMLEFKMDS